MSRLKNVSFWRVAVRFLLTTFVACGLVGCITAGAPSLSPEALATFRLTEVSVDYTPNAMVHVSDAEDDISFGRAHVAGEVRDGQGMPRQEDIQAYERQRMADILREAFLQKVAPKLAGQIPVKARVLVSHVNVPGALGAIVLGGNAAITAGVDLVDAKTGVVVASLPANQGASAYRGGGILAAALNPAIEKAMGYNGAAERLAAIFAEDYANWLVRR